MVVAASSMVLRIWQNIVEETKYDNMEGKMGEEGKEFFNSKWTVFRKDKLLGEKSPFNLWKSWWCHRGNMKLDD